MGPVFWKTAGLLVLSNVFMTFAWYAHLKNLDGRPWLIAVAISWGIAFFEYLIQVPANDRPSKIGHARRESLGSPLPPRPLRTARCPTQMRFHPR